MAATGRSAPTRARRRSTGPSSGCRTATRRRWALPGVIPVQLDWDCPRERYRTSRIDGVEVYRASGFPREIPGVPRERNLSGISFAVANVTGLLARLGPTALTSLLAARRLECLGL